MRSIAWVLRLVLVGLAIFQVVTGNVPGAIVAGEGLVVSLLPLLLRRLSGVKIAGLVEVLFVFGMVLQFVSESTKLFELFTYWDKIVHPTLVALTAWIAAWLLLGYRDAYRARLPIHVVGAMSLLLGMAVGMTWEYVEFASDWFGDADLQKSTADTMTDLISNDTGAFVATLLALRLFPRWLSVDERIQTGQLARWLAHGPGVFLDRHGVPVGAVAALALIGALVAGNAIDAGWPAPPASTAQASTLDWSPGQPAQVLAGDWVPDPERGTCRVNLERPKPGSEKMGLLELAPGQVYQAPVRYQARVFEQRPEQSAGTQMDGGLAFGIRDASDFYLLEQSALHDVLRLDRIVHNRRRDLHERLVRTHGNEWHTLQVRIDGTQVVAGIDGQDVFGVPLNDAAGGVGLWARTAAATCFDQAHVQPSGS